MRLDRLARNSNFYRYKYNARKETRKALRQIQYN